MSVPDPALTDAQLLDLKTRAASLAEEAPETRVAVSIIRTLSKNLTDEEWIGLYRGVAPDLIPLTPRQLEAMRGGLAFEGLAFPFPVRLPSLD